MITHTGRSIPVLPTRWDPSDKAWIWVVWDQVLGGATITTSTWTLPAGWTEHDTKTAQATTDESGNSYSAANGVLTSNSIATPGGQVEIANKVVLSDGREFERSVMIVVAQQ